MKRKLVALFVSGIMLFSLAGFAASAETAGDLPATGVQSPYTDYAEGLNNSTEGEVTTMATGLISTFFIKLYKYDSDTIIADICTCGMDIMAQIGVKNLRVQRYINNTWTTYIEFDSLETDTSMHAFSYTTPNLPTGYYYRFTGDHYAKEQGWFFPASQTIHNETSYLYIG